MMKKRMVLSASTLLISIALYAQSEHEIDVAGLKEEFNISQYWHEGMSWYEFLSVRNGLERDGLIQYVDKVEQQRIGKAAGLEVPETYIITREKVPFAELISDLQTYVAKVTHLSYSQGLIVVKDGINLITGEPITPEQVQESIFETMDEKPREIESWALHHVPAGFIIQEYVPNRAEVKIQTVWGKAIIGEWRGGEPKTPTTPIWGRYDRDGNLVDGSEPTPEWWSKAIELAERVSVGTDALRVDFLVKEGGVLLLNEFAIWPESGWQSMRAALEERLNDGYRLKVAESIGSN